ncbi:unnamed protein product, partial [Polarella glacialis]
MEDLLSICKECLQELVEIRHHMRAVDSHMLALDKLAELVVALPKTGSSSSGRSLPSSPTEAQPKSLPDSQEAQEAQESSRAEEDDLLESLLKQLGSLRRGGGSEESSAEASREPFCAEVASVSSAASLQPRAWNAVPAGSVSHQPPAEASAKEVYKPVAALPPVDLIAKKLPVADSPVQVAVVSPSPGGGQPAASSARSNASSAALAAEPSSQSPCVVQSLPVATAPATSLSSAFAPASWPLASRPLPAGPLAPGGVAPTKVTTVAPASSASTRSSTSMPGSVAHISPPNSQDQLSKSPITDGSDADHALDTEDSAQKLIEGESDSDEAPTQ